MPGLLPHVDPEGLLEFSVVYTDRALNHMSQRFQGVMRQMSGLLKTVYGAHSAIVMPGSGSFGMEAVARQFATGKRVQVLRNGWFSYRWSQIFDMGSIPSHCTVHKARRLAGDAAVAGAEVAGAPLPWVPAPIEAVCASIRAEQAEVVFAPHVETSAGMILPDDYLRAVADAVHAHGGLFVLDCIASGAAWVDMRATGVDVLISAPQKGWSGSPGCAFVLLSEHARAVVERTVSTSFAADLRKWLQVMETYEAGGHVYHTTMPTDALASVCSVMQETADRGFGLVCEQQWVLGRSVRALLQEFGYASVAAPGFEAPGVVVSYTTDPELQNGKKFMALGLQSAAGVPLQCDEGPDFRTFRLGLFGLDKLAQPERSVEHLRAALRQLAAG